MDIAIGLCHAFKTMARSIRTQVGDSMDVPFLHGATNEQDVWIGRERIHRNLACRTARRLWPPKRERFQLQSH
jgi:hypothetical protein